MAVIDDALTAHRNGDIAKAEMLYRAVLKADGRHFDALHMLGVLCAQRGNFAEAEQHLRVALAVDQAVPPCLHNYGRVLSALARYDEAIAAFDRALALAPDYVPVYLDRGNALLAAGRVQDALASYDRALALEPRFAPAHYSRGIVLEQLRRDAEALSSYERAVALHPRFAEAETNRAGVLERLGRYQDALNACDRALALSPDLAQAHYNRAVVLAKFARYREALEACGRALAIDPGLAQAHSNRAFVLERLRRYPEAIAACDRALALRPDLAQAHCNRGVVLTKLNRFAEALECFDRAAAIDPNLAQVHCNRGSALRHTNRLDEAMASFQKALAIEPGSADAHFNLGELRLLRGDFAGGLPEYEWRWQSGPAIPNLRKFSQPLWHGAEPLAGKTILLHSEQGLGDTIQFCRYAPLLAARGARVVLEVQASLVELLKNLPGVAQVIATGGVLPAFDLQCPLASLPLALATRLETIPADVPYLSVSAAFRDKWTTKIEATAGAARLKVGIAWAGNPNLPNDHIRSIDLQTLSALFATPGVQFFSLQKELRDGDAALLGGSAQVVHLGEAIESFADTAAIVALLDVIVSADTAVAHLAGALAAKTWILLPYVAEWRWLLGRADSPWYPTARLFRQPALNDWAGAVAAVGEALREIAQDGRVPAAAGQVSA